MITFFIFLRIALVLTNNKKINFLKQQKKGQNRPFYITNIETQVRINHLN